MLAAAREFAPHIPSENEVSELYHTVEVDGFGRRLPAGLSHSFFAPTDTDRFGEPLSPRHKHVVRRRGRRPPFNSRAPPPRPAFCGVRLLRPGLAPRLDVRDKSLGPTTHCASRGATSAQRLLPASSLSPRAQPVPGPGAYDVALPASRGKVGFRSGFVSKSPRILEDGARV